MVKYELFWKSTEVFGGTTNQVRLLHQTVGGNCYNIGPLKCTILI